MDLIFEVLRILCFLAVYFAMPAKKCAVCHVEVKNHVGPHGKGKCSEEFPDEPDGSTLTLTAVAAQLKDLTDMMHKMQAQSNVSKPTADNCSGASNHSADSKGQSYDEMFPSATHAVSTDSNNYLDPRGTLLNRQQVKAIHITEFLNDKTKARRKNKRHDLVLSTSDDQTSVLVRSDDPHLYSGITLDEWNGANMRVLNHLLTGGVIARTDMEFYLAYTATVNDFYQKYTWDSILQFDCHYRDQQAALGFKWGYINPQLELQILVPLRRDRDMKNYNTYPRGKPVGSEETHFRPECKQWKASGGHCRFGQSCKYRHVPLTGFKSQHESNESEEKNSTGHREW